MIHAWSGLCDNRAKLLKKEASVVDKALTFLENTASFSEGFPSGQRDQTVNLTAQPSEVRILPPPPVLYKAEMTAGVVQW